jgi:hypothetical protein
MTVMTLMTVIYGSFLDRGWRLYFRDSLSPDYSRMDPCVVCEYIPQPFTRCPEARYGRTLV